MVFVFSTVVVVVVEIESTFAVSPLPQDAVNRPRARANTPGFTSFMIFLFFCLQVYTPRVKRQLEYFTYLLVIM